MSENAQTALRPIKVYRAEANLIPVSRLPEDFVDEAIRRYTFSFYDEKACEKCPLLEQRHSEACDSCEKFLVHRQLAKVVKKGDKDYLSLPIGGTKRRDNLLDEHNLRPIEVDKFVGENLARAIRMKRSLREWQEEAVEVCIARKRGLVVAPPRSGKTVFGVAMTVKLQAKTLVIASQRDWLEQFKSTYVGSDDEEAFTSLSGRRIGFCSEVEDFEKYDVCLATFQQFMNARGRKILRQVGHLFKLVLVDEAHGTSALETSRVLSRFSAEYLFGLTGTPKRKNSAEEIVFKLLIGPIIYRAKVDKLVPRVSVLKTGVEINVPGGPQARNRGAFARFIGKLEIEKTRVKVISRFVAKAVKAGYSVMIPVTRVKSVQIYINAINEYFPENVCCPFIGSLKKDVRKRNLKEIKDGTVRVIVGNLALLSTGLNIPRLSMLIDRVTITSNIPKAEQRIARILTPMEGKRQPRLVIVMDECDIQRSTARNEYFNCIKPTFDPVIKDEDREALYEWFKRKKNSGADLGTQPKRGRDRRSGRVLMNHTSL